MTEEPAMTLTRFVRHEGTFVPDVTGVGKVELLGPLATSCRSNCSLFRVFE